MLSSGEGGRSEPVQALQRAVGEIAAGSRHETTCPVELRAHKRAAT
ncbi:MAG: hypothetical protein LC790_04635 [Actinobacteria bacterium]|nr:hypothetical protein [Actinomycetota bacterium]